LWLIEEKKELCFIPAGWGRGKEGPVSGRRKRENPVHTIPVFFQGEEDI